MLYYSGKECDLSRLITAQNIALQCRHVWYPIIDGNYCFYLQAISINEFTGLHFTGANSTV